MMYKVEELILITGIDFDMGKYPIKVHQPSIEELALIGGEKRLYQCLSIFYIKDEALNQFLEIVVEDEDELERIKEEVTYYDTLLFLLQSLSNLEDAGDEYEELLNMIRVIFGLLFHSHTFQYIKEENLMMLTPNEEGGEYIVVDKEFFLDIRSIAISMFKLDLSFEDDIDESNMSEAAKEIAAKMKAAEERIRKNKGQDDEDAEEQFPLMISILSTEKSIAELRKLTVYQLLDQFERFNLRLQHDSSVRAAMAGSEDVEIVNWYKKL